MEQSSMSSSTTSSLVANRKGVLFKLRDSFLLSLTMTARNALVLHRATRHSGKYVGRLSTWWRCRSQPFKVLRFVTPPGTKINAELFAQIRTDKDGPEFDD